MAFILAPAYSQSCYSPSSFCSPVSRPAHRYWAMCSQPRRPQYSSFNHFFGQIDELLGEISHQAQRQAQIEAYRKIHNQRQLRKRALRAQFAVTENGPGWQINGDVQGFEQANLNVEVTNEYTLKITGNIEWQLEKVVSQSDNVPAEPVSDDSQINKKDNSTLTEAETTTIAPDSDTESHKSYQATVEDDFEDLGGETSSMISASSESFTVSEVGEPKGKEKMTEEPSASETKDSSESQKEESEEQERQHGSFERTFQFPKRIDTANVRATFKDGTLSITVPKAPVQQTKKIDIL